MQLILFKSSKFAEQNRITMMQPADVYREGGYRGLSTGIYFTLMFLTAIWSDQMPALSMITVALAVGVPFFIYRHTAVVYIKYGRTARFSDLWMLGIMLFLCGGLICAIIAYSYLHYIVPGYLYEQTTKAIDIYSKLPTKDPQMVTALQTAAKQGLLPSDIEFVVEMLWFQIFSGSLLSLLLAYIVRKKQIR